jgi:hypothetical protein
MNFCYQPGPTLSLKGNTFHQNVLNRFLKAVKGLNLTAINRRLKALMMLNLDK